MNKLFQTRTALAAVIITAGLSFGILSCKKDSATAVTVTEADAAELATDAIVPTNAGFVVQVNSSISIYRLGALSCGISKDSTISGSSAAGATPSYNYSLKWNYSLSCNGIVPNQLTFNFTGSHNYDGLRMSASDKTSGGFVLTNLPATFGSYGLSTTYTRAGTSTSKIGRNNTFTSNFTLTTTNLLVDKVTQQITSGTGTFAVTGSSTSGASFSYGGTITFLGGAKATIVFNGGASYTIQW